MITRLRVELNCNRTILTMIVFPSPQGSAKPGEHRWFVPPTSGDGLEFVVHPGEDASGDQPWPPNCMCCDTVANNAMAEFTDTIVYNVIHATGDLDPSLAFSLYYLHQATHQVQPLPSHAAAAAAASQPL